MTYIYVMIHAEQNRLPDLPRLVATNKEACLAVASNTVTCQQNFTEVAQCTESVRMLKTRRKCILRRMVNEEYVSATKLLVRERWPDVGHCESWQRY